MPNQIIIDHSHKGSLIDHSKNKNYIFPKTSNTLSFFKSTKSRQPKRSEEHCNPKQTNQNFQNIQSLQQNSNKANTSSAVSCTVFIKGYVDKLKIQNKRKAKKLSYSSNKIMTEDKKLNQKQFYLIAGKNCVKKHKSQILEFGRNSQSESKGFLKTISVISENVRISKMKKSRNKSEERQLLSESQLKKIEKLQSLINEVKKKRLDIANAQEILAMPNEALQQMRTSFQKNFQILPRRKCPSINMRKQKNTQGNFKMIDPWRSQNNINQFSIEQYKSNL